MYLDAFLNQKVQVKFKNFPENMVGDMTGIYLPEEWYLVKLIHVESIGIWIEHPCFKRTPIQKEDGTTIPEDAQKEETCTTHIMIRWEHIASFIAFPETNPQADRKTKLIGFQPDFT